MPAKNKRIEGVNINPHEEYTKVSGRVVADDEEPKPFHFIIRHEEHKSLNGPKLKELIDAELLNQLNSAFSEPKRATMVGERITEHYPQGMTFIANKDSLDRIAPPPKEEAKSEEG